MHKNLDKQYKRILMQERSIAKRVSHAFVKPKPLTVWEVMLPIIFIFTIMRLKETREIFTLNILFTKQLALNAALAMLKEDRPREAVMADIKSKTNEVLASDTKKLYSVEIQQQQMKEINLLIDHYCKLFASDGKDYASMVIDAYRTRENYSDFLVQLTAVEKEVTLTAQKKLNAMTDDATVAKIERILDRARTDEINKIFGTAVES